MAELYQSLSHARWSCQYHVVCVPKRRRKKLCGAIRRQLGPIFPELARQKACRLREGHVRPEHGPMGIEVPPKQAVASVMGLRKGHRAMAIARQFGGHDRQCAGEPFGARGDAVSTVGCARAQVKASIRDHNTRDDEGRC